MKKKKSIIILVSSLLIISLVSYIAFAAGDNQDKKTPLDYGLFASENIEMGGSGGDIKADIWANNFLGFYGVGFVVRGDTWSSNNIREAGSYTDSSNAVWQNSGLNIGDKAHIITARKDMIQMMDNIKEMVKSENNYSEVTGDLDFSKLSPSEIALGKDYIASGNITVSMTNSNTNKNLNNYLIAEGNINIDLNNFIGKEDNKQDISNIRPVMIASNKDIIIRGNPVIVGTIYAPNGTVKIEGSGTYLIGNIIAKNIRVSGAGLFMNDESKIAIKEDL